MVYTQLVRTVKRPYMAGVSTIGVWGVGRWGAD